MSLPRRRVSSFLPRGLRRMKFRSTSYLRKKRVFNAPVARSVRSTPGRITFGSKGNSKSIVVRNREYVCDVTVPASNAFTVSVDSLISPVNGRLFPWLSGIAGHFDNYSFKKLSFHYEPACTSATTGQVLIVPDYDPVDDAPSDWSRGAAMEGANHCGAWTPLNVSCSGRGLAKRKTYYCEMPSLPQAGTVDVRECAVGRLSVCTENVSNNGLAFAAGTSIGKVYVSYKIVLYEPDYSNYLSAYSSGVGARLIANTADIANIGDAGGYGAVLSSLNGTRLGSVPFTDNGSGLWTCTSPCEVLITLGVAAATNANVYVNTFTGNAAVVGQSYDAMGTGAVYVATKWTMTAVKFNAGDTWRITSAATVGLAVVTLYIAPYPYSMGRVH